MAENSNIEWCDHTFNPWIGCKAISPGCTNCYAADWAKRYGRDFSKRTRTKTWAAPLKWESQHAEFFAQHGRRQRVFCASLADVFDNEVSALWRVDLFSLIANTPNLDWLLLTKRIGNARPMLDEVAGLVMGIRTRAEWLPLKNVWIGATVVNQEEADRDVPKLLAVPAHRRFLSIEPMLGPINLEKPMPGPDIDQGGGGSICQPWMIQSGLDQVIAGGESGCEARAMHPDNPRSLRDQCEAAGVPFLFKQWGEWVPMMGHTEGVPVRGPKLTLPDGTIMGRAGKKAAGRMLDGRTYDGYPA